MLASRRCSRCGVSYPPHLVEAAFRLSGVSLHASSETGKYRGRVCKRCEQTVRDAKKHANRYRVKARDIRRRHAPRLGVAIDELIARGWDIEQIAHDIEFRYGNGCDYCWHPFAEMGHGLSDITLDIVDRDKPPDYRTNTKWCCQTCNRKKGTMTPQQFELDLQMNRWHDQQVVAMQTQPQEHGRLFYLQAS